MTQVDFAIITMREDEFKAVWQRFPAKAQTGSSGRVYRIAQIKTKTGKNCTVAIARCVEQGNVAAQQIANDVISDLDPQVLLVVDIASGVPCDDFTLGDVIISNHIDNFRISKRYQDGTETFDMRGGIHPAINDIAASLHLYGKELANWQDTIELSRPSVDLSQFDTVTFKDKIAANADKDSSSWYQDIKDSIVRHFSRTRAPLCETGRIVSCNNIVRDDDLLIHWLQNARSILAVEMEAVGVYQAIQRKHQLYPAMAICGISGIIGLERDNQWTNYACQTAAAFTYAFITAGIISPRVTSRQTQVPPPAVQSKNLSDETESISVFISYAQKDEKFRKQLETYLSMLKRDDIINTVYSQDIDTGQERVQEIANGINRAQVILLLVSPNFLAAKQVYQNMIRLTMEKHEQGTAYVIPITLSQVELGDTPLQKLQSFPRDGRPIESWRRTDDVWSEIAKQIRHVYNKLRNSARDSK